MVQKQSFGDYIKGLRTDKHIGVRELGRVVDVTGMHISNIEKGKSLPSRELITKLAEALEANVDEMLHLADQIDPEVADVIQSNPYSAPSLLRTAKSLTPEQWEKLQKQVEKMAKENEKDS